MAKEIELENTYLLETLPKELVKDWKKEYTKDIYYPPRSDNPQIRLRQRGEGYFITKKYPLKEGDLSTMVEETIKLSEVEYKFLDESLSGKSVEKNRYSKYFEEYSIEVDEYLGNLAKLVIVDIEWKIKHGNHEQIVEQFHPVREITNTSELAAGRIAGKTYDDIKYFIK